MGSLESESSPVGVGDDFEPSFVYDDVMVEPAQDDQLGLVGPAALGPRGEMVDLETVSALTAVGGTGEPGFGQ